MPIEQITEAIYRFIKNYGETHYVKLTNIRLFAQSKRISMGEMGYALQILKQQGKVRFTKRVGWVAS